MYSESHYEEPYPELEVLLPTTPRYQGPFRLFNLTLVFHGHFDKNELWRIR